MGNILLKESQWFQPNPIEINRSYKEMYNNYKSWLVKGKRQGYFSRTYFAFENMKANINEILNNNINLPEEVKLELPKLKLPKLKKV